MAEGRGPEDHANSKKKTKRKNIYIINIILFLKPQKKKKSNYTARQGSFMAIDSTGKFKELNYLKEEKDEWPLLLLDFDNSCLFLILINSKSFWLAIYQW